MDSRSILAESPLFASLSDAALDGLARLCEPFELYSGKVLFSEGEPSTHFYVVAMGRLRVTMRGEVIGYAGRLEPLGEIGVISGQPRSARIHAIRDSVLLRIERNAFLSFLTQYPQALMSVTQILVLRLRQNQRAQKLQSARGARTFAILPATPDIDGEGFARLFARQLAVYHSTTRLVCAADVDAEFGAGTAAAALSSDDRSTRLTNWLNALEGAHRYVIFAATRNPDPWALRCMHQADRVIVVANGADAECRGAMLDELGSSDILAPVELALLRPEGASAANVLGWRDRTKARAHYFLRADNEADLASLTRQISGRGIGLVLGGGGARGFTHIGLIRALEELRIPIDITGGASMGAFVAALLACGWNSADIARIARETFVANNFLNDYTLPRVSLIRGRKFLARLRQVLGDRRIEEMLTPYFCVTTNLTTGSQMIHDRGPLDVWLGTSMSVPGIAPPVAWRGELLCDGSVINSLPTDVMQSLERGPIIASDVSTEGDIRATGAGMEAPEPEALLRWKGSEEPPGLRDILFRTATLTSESGTQRRAERAELYIRMPVAGIGLFDWKKLNELIERGYQHAIAKLTPAKASLLR